MLQRSGEVALLRAVLPSLAPSLEDSKGELRAAAMSTIAALGQATDFTKMDSKPVVMPH